MASLLEILKTEYANEYDMKRYTDPKIYHGGKSYDITRRWYVYYSFMHPDTGKFTRQKPIYFSINRRFKTKSERMKHLRALRDSLHDLLKRGFSPYGKKTKTDSNIVKALRFALLVKKDEVKPTTYKDYEFRVKMFNDFLYHNGYDVFDSNEITKRIVVDFLNTIENAKNRNNTKAGLSSIFSVLSDEDIIPINFIKEIRNKKVNLKPITIYSPDNIDDVTNLLKQQDKTLLMFIYFVSYMFWRPIEAVRIRKEDIDFKNNIIKAETKTKTLKTKIIPSVLLDDLKEYAKDKESYLFMPDGFKDWKIDDDDKRKYITRRFARFRKKNNIESIYKIYSFRHTYITKIYVELRKHKNKENTIKELSLITGHTSSAIWNYIQVNDIELPQDYSGYL